MNLVKLKKIKRWINTETVWDFVDGQYVEIENKGYWYEGAMALAHNQAATDQVNFRFYDSSGTAVAAQDTDPTTLTTDTAYRFMVQIDNGGDIDETSWTYEIQYNLNAAGWNNITTSSSVVKAVGAGLTDTSATSDTLTGGLGTFVAGENSTDGVTAAMVITTGNHTEHQFGIEIISTDVVDGDSIDIRCTNNSYTALDAYTSNPTITVNEPAATQTINADYLASAATVAQPTLSYPPQTLNADYLASASAVYDPTLSGIATITADYLASASAVYQSAFTAEVTLTSDYLASNAVIPQPSLNITTALVIDADYLASASTVYQPTLGGEVTLTSDYLASASTVYQPTMGGQVTLTADYLASAATVYDPTLTGVVTINADYLASASTVFDPTLSGITTIAADYLASASQAYEPTISIGQTIAPDYLASSSIIYQPVLSTIQNINADYLPSSSQVYNATLLIQVDSTGNLIYRTESNENIYRTDSNENLYRAVSNENLYTVDSNENLYRIS